jgi:tetrahydromethanopterin S-methyltransferase subunit G
MSVVEDSRKILQDFIAPELRAIAARLEALEKRFDGFENSIGQRFEAAEKHFDQRMQGFEKRLDDLEHRADKRHDEVMAAIRQVIDYNSIQQRLARLESKESAHQ